MTRPPTVLIVEDEPAILALYTRALREAGFDVAAAPDGLEGLRMALAVPFDIVVTNSRMPVLNGAEMVRQLRRHRPDQAILHVSGSHGTTSPPEQLPSDVPTIYKPFSLDALVESVRGLLAGPMSPNRHNSGP
jgi:DNA-binding response OmpR family regulator